MTRALSALSLLFALAVCPLVVHADDYGPRRDVAAIRHDLPIIERGHVVYFNVLQNITVDAVVVDGGMALAQFRDERSIQIVELVDRFGRWWLDDYVFVGDIRPSACFPAYIPDPEYLEAHSVPSALVGLATNHFPAVQEAIAIFQHRSQYRCFVGADLVDPAYWPQVLPFKHTILRFIGEGGGYQAMIKLAPNDGDENAQVVDIRSRAPTQAESWANPPSGNSYFFISGTVESTKIVHVNGGTTLDVWFPFVLDPSLRYSLTIAAPNTLSLGPIDGTLANNTLHFVLPAFNVTPGAELMGEIESD